MTRHTSLVHLATVVAAAGTAALVACAASPQRDATQDVERPPVPPSTPDREEILDLESEMRQWRVELGLKPSPMGALAANGAVAEVCEGLTECEDACKLADAICQNKDRICDIADRLDDEWASGKCADAKRSCSEAKKVCQCCEQRQQRGLLPSPDNSQPCAPPER